MNSEIITLLRFANGSANVNTEAMLQRLQPQQQQSSVTSDRQPMTIRQAQ